MPHCLHASNCPTKHVGSSVLQERVMCCSQSPAADSASEKSWGYLNRSAVYKHVIFALRFAISVILAQTSENECKNSRLQMLFKLTEDFAMHKNENLWPCCLNDKGENWSVPLAHFVSLESTLRTMNYLNIVRDDEVLVELLIKKQSQQHFHVLWRNTVAAMWRNSWKYRFHTFIRIKWYLTKFRQFCGTAFGKHLQSNH